MTSKPRILFAPSRLDEGCSKLKYFREIFTEVQPGEDFDLSMVMDYIPEHCRSGYTGVDDFDKQGKPCINGGLAYMDKNTVENAFHYIFGYSSRPAVGDNCVKKHPGQCIKEVYVERYTGREKPGYFYQIFFSENHLYTEIRTIIFEQQLQEICWYKLRQSTPEKPLGETLKEDAASIYKVFNKDEVNKINEFCRFMKLDYGELDISHYGGRFYIIDVNNCPGDRVLKDVIKEWKGSAFLKWYADKFLTMVNNML